MGLGFIELALYLALVGDAPPSAACRPALGAFTVKKSELVTLDFSTESAALKTVLSKSFLNQTYGAVKTRWGIVELGELIGRGYFGRVFRLKTNPRWVIKVPVRVDSIWDLQQEAANSKIYSDAGIPIPRFYDPAASDFVVIREYIEGIPLADILQNGGPSEAQLSSLVDLFVKAYRRRLVIDLQDPNNLVWSETKKQFFLIDVGAPILSSTGIGGAVNITSWRQVMGVKADAFVAAATQVLGESAIQELEAGALHQARIRHALHHDPILNGFGF